jgi:hypothetical protein
MHYKNGREVKMGDQVVGSCNLQSKEFLHIDDVLPNKTTSP